MHRSDRFIISCCFVATYLTMSLPAHGQILYGQKAAGGLDIVATHWKLTVDSDEVTVDQWAIPASAFVPLGENFEGRVYVAQAMNTVTQLGQDFEMNGLTDMRLQVNHSFSEDRLLFGVGVNLPVGHKALSLDQELIVMNYLTQSFLSFPVRNLGQGFGLNLMAGGATEMGAYRVGATATFDFSGAYEAYAGEADYNPGNSFILTLGLQRDLGKRVLNGDVTLTVSADDKQADVPVFSRGEQFTLHAGLDGGGASNRYLMDLYYNIRGRNTAYDPAGILLQQLKVYGNEFITAGGYEWTSDSGWSYGPSADLRLIAANEVGLGSSTILGLSGQVSRALTSAVTVRLAAKYYSGSTQGGDIDLSGFQTWITASATF